jgi:hypothetical protein
MAKEKEISTKDQAEQYFKENISKTSVYATSDGFLFEQKKYALDHANSLDESKRNVENFTNALHLEVEAEEITE